MVVITADGRSHLIPGPASMQGRTVDLTDLPDVRWSTSRDALVAVTNLHGSVLPELVRARLAGLDVPIYRCAATGRGQVTE